jgi:hypothetical protein
MIKPVCDLSIQGRRKANLCVMALPDLTGEESDSSTSTLASKKPHMVIKM